MAKLLTIGMAGMSLWIGTAGCAILAPEQEREWVDVAGTVYVDGAPARGFGVTFFFLTPACALFCDLVAKEIGATETDVDGTYGIRVESDGGWSCDTELVLEVTGYTFQSQHLAACATYSGVDFRLPGGAN